jgi:hypothetical protein
MATTSDKLHNFALLTNNYFLLPMYEQNFLPVKLSPALEAARPTSLIPSHPLAISHFKISRIIMHFLKSSNCPQISPANKLLQTSLPPLPLLKRKPGFNFISIPRFNMVNDRSFL